MLTMYESIVCFEENWMRFGCQIKQESEAQGRNFGWNLKKQTEWILGKMRTADSYEIRKMNYNYAPICSNIQEK